MVRTPSNSALSPSLSPRAVTPRDFHLFFTTEADEMSPPYQQRRGPLNELHEAALYGCPHQMMDLLRDGSIDINQGTPTGSTALMLAAQQGRAEVARVLLDKGANMSIAAQRGFTVLLIAAQQGHSGVVVELLNAGAEVDACNDNNDTSLHLGDHVCSPHSSSRRVGVLPFVRVLNRHETLPGNTTARVAHIYCIRSTSQR